jgi:hypothetical protein
MELWKICLKAIVANCKESSFLVVTISLRHRSKLDFKSPQPSWLPDFTQKPHYDSKLFWLPEFWKHWRAPPRLKLSPDHRVLTTSATVIDIVHTTKLLDFDPYEDQKDFQETERIASTSQAIVLSANHLLYTLRQNLNVEVWVLLLLNLAVKIFGNLAKHDMLEKCRSLYKLLVKGNPRDRPKRPTNLDELSGWYWTEEASAALFAKEMFRLTHNLSFITTSAGFLGIGPREFEEGDKILILDGTDSVVVLRPRGDTSRNEHILLGSVYLMGICNRYGMLERLSRNGKLKDDVFNLV